MHRQKEKTRFELPSPNLYVYKSKNLIKHVQLEKIKTQNGISQY